MIRKIRTRFITMSMITLFVMLTVIMTAINLLNYMSFANSSDETLEIIAENKGRIPDGKDKGDKKSKPEKKEDISPETPYETRYFSVIYNKDGKTVHYNTEHIAAVDGDAAKKYADDVLRQGEIKGSYGVYRYLVTESDKGTAVTFLDCEKALDSVRTFFVISILISLAGLLAVFVLIYFLSKRIIRPFIEGQEKQKRFIADAGHEIKTPVTIIDADAEVLRLEMGDNEWIDDIKRQTKRMGSLTDDLIFLSRIDDNPTLTLCEVDLSRTVKETIEDFGTIAKIKNIDLNFEAQENVVIRADERAVQRLMSALVDNAVKYSPENDTVTATLKTQPKTAVITIENTAPNLERSDVARIFDRFYRADKSRNNEVSGYGLGLSMAKAIVESHKGKISASLTRSRFKITVTLPI